MKRSDREDGSMTINGEEIRYSIIRSSRARRFSVIVDEQGGVRVRGPQKSSEKALAAFLRTNAQWVLRTRESMKKRRRTPVDARDGMFVPHFGRQVRLSVTPGVSKAELRGTNGHSTLALPASSSDGREPIDFLRMFYMHETASYLNGRIPAFERLTGLHSARYELKEFRSKWGSCAPSGTIRFNAKLSAFPEDVIDYVIVHELCHLMHRKHDAKFWNHVSSFLPDFRYRKEQLRKMALEMAFAW